MESPKILYKYYSNPAFCGQSEVVFSQKTPCVTSKISGKRVPPLGATSPRKIEKNNHRIRTDISDNPLRITPGSKFRDVPPELPPKPQRYTRGNFQRSASARCRTQSQELEMTVRRTRSPDFETSKHRYEFIDFDDDIDYSPTKKRIVQAHDEDVLEYNVDAPDEHEMVEIPSEIIKTVNGKTHRYAIVPSDDEDVKKPTVTFSSTEMSKKSLIATQKLHELLTTPRKLKSYGSQPSVRTPNKSYETPRVHVTPNKFISSTPTKVTPSKSCANLSISKNLTSPISPRALQKLSYEEDRKKDVFVRSFRERSSERTFDDRRNRSLDFDRRERSYESRIEPVRKDKTTAVISPRVASPSVYSEDTTYKSFSSLKSTTATASLALAAVMMTLCGGLTAGLSFYMMYSVGRRYYLDFGVLSGFTCLLLGLLGFRSRRNQLLPNRNYISGYILLSTFSLLSATGLLILLTTQPKPGTPQNDITSGAVCALSVISLLLASFGVITSYCCKHPPPDNRVGSATRWY